MLPGSDSSQTGNAAMSQRKPLSHRQPNGRVRPITSEVMAPSQVKRLIEAASDGLRDPIWSSMLGRLKLTDKISSVHFAAGKRWCELTAAYSRACQSPKPPSTVLLDATGSMASDPDSEIGRKEAKKHERESADFIGGKDTLRRAGPAVEGVVEQVCILDCAPGGLYELNAFRLGLQALSDRWSSKRRSARGK